MIPQETPHISCCTVAKLRYLSIWSSPIQKRNFPAMSNILSIRRNGHSNEHLNWSAKIQTGISDSVAPYITTRHKPHIQRRIRILFTYASGPGWPNSQVFLPIASPYTILKCLIEVHYQMKKVSTGRQSLVHYHFLKPVRRKPPAMKVPIRETIREIMAPKFNVPTRNHTNRSSAPQRDFDQSYYTEWPPLPAP